MTLPLSEIPWSREDPPDSADLWREVLGTLADRVAGGSRQPLDEVPNE